ncbi:terpene synthase family protein [Nocardia brasiliensis]|uniref:terpene synthase family protein n=1 Tax=Nocardia brasiliensis TaxID=37326 RepID=UPI002455CDAC|nr:terpene synthase family protein [Nocardia brasiliensis]
MDVTLPFAACRNPAVDPTYDALSTWVSNIGMAELRSVKGVFTTTRVGEFSSYAYPFSDHSTRAMIDGWVLWTLIVDELFEEKLTAGELNPWPSDSDDPATALAAVDPLAAPKHHLNALADLSARTVEDMPATWQREFHGHVAKFVRSCHQEAANRLSRTDTTVDIPGFAALRRGSFATDMFMDLVERVYRVPAPEGPAITPIVAELRACAADLGGWCNDVLSYRREVGSEDRNNLVLLLTLQTSAPIEQAVRNALTRVHDRAWQFVTLKSDLARLLRHSKVSDCIVADAFQWVLGIELLVSGSLTFQRLSQRWQEQ